jgi:hypothetical protein
MELDQAKRWFTEARDLTQEARRRSDQCFDYYDNRQLSSDYVKALRKRRQPEIWINRIAPSVNGILGVMEQGQTDPRAFPRNEEDTDSSEVATDALRYAAENARWNRTKAMLAKDYLIGGIAATIVEVDAKNDPMPRRIRWGEFFYDPHSRDYDFEDARFMGIAKWMYVDEVRSIFPQQEEPAVVDEATGEIITPARIIRDEVSIDSLTSNGQMDWDDEDKPNGGFGGWGDRKLKRVLVAEMYYRERDGWHRCVFYGGGILEEGPSAYLDEDGNPSNPIVAQSANVDRDNMRYGIVTAMIPVQDEVNMRRSKLLNLVNSRQVMVTDPGNFMTDLETVRREAARPDGVLPPGVSPAPTADMAAGQAQLLAEAKSELERFGPAPGVLGRQSADSSGRAQLVRQQAGLVELAPVLAGMEDLELRVYRQTWARIRQFWNEPKFVRVTDDVGAAKFLQVNEPIMGPPQVGMDPQTGMPVIQPQVVGWKNRPADMDMDIIIDATPDTATIQQEQFAELAKLAATYGPQEVPFDDLLKASMLPKKRELIEQREARKKEAAEAQGPGQQAQQAMFKAELENKTADTEQKRANAFKATVDAETNEAKAMLSAFQQGQAMAETPPPGEQERARVS